MPLSVTASDGDMIRQVTDPLFESVANGNERV